MSPAGSFHPSPYSSPRERQRKIDEVDDDKRSTLSHSSGVPRPGQPGKDALRLVAGNRVRHGRCVPDFLEEISTKGVSDSLRRATSKRFKVIAGSEARTFFKNYIIQHTKKDAPHSRTIDDSFTPPDVPQPIVFAVTAWDGGSKCVDYYMTWRATPKAHQSPALEKKIDHLDTDFRRLAKVLDREFRRVSSMKAPRNNSQTSRKPAAGTGRKSQPPPGITLSSAGDAADKPGVPLDPSLPDPPPSATDSVMSLPLLNMVRGVPFSHRVPLRITNPDRLSMVSEISIVPGKPTDEDSAPKAGHQEANNKLTVPALSKLSKNVNNEDKVRKSSASIMTSDTKSSKSSQSSRSSSRSGNQPSRNASPGNEENEERTSRRRHTDSEGPIEFMIYLLGDKLDIDLHSWHGLEKQTSIRSVPAERHSPWIGPLASQDVLYPYPPYSYTYSTASRTPEDTDTDSDASDDGVQEIAGAPGDWKTAPVIPMKPLLESMGYLAPSTVNGSSYYNSPVIPGGMPYQHVLSNAGGSPAPSVGGSPYLYSSPRMDPLPYVPAWLPSLQTAPSAASSRPSSRPSSRAYSPAYASPYMQSHTGPF